MQLIDNSYNYNAPPGDQLDIKHGSAVAAMVNGHRLGTCKKCTVVWFKSHNWQGFPNNVVRETLIEQLYSVLNDIGNDGTKAVINISHGYKTKIGPATIRAMSEYILGRVFGDMTALIN